MLDETRSIAELFDEAVRANTDAVVCIIDPEGELLDISASVIAIHGYSPAEMVGRNFAEFFDADDVTHLSLVIQDCLLTGESIENTRRVIHKAGGYTRMRGRARKHEDATTGKVSILSIARQCEE